LISEERFRKEHYIPKIFSRENRREWEKNGAKPLTEKALIESLKYFPHSTGKRLSTIIS